MSSRVVVVEDELATRRLVEFLLTKDGFEVHGFPNGREALEAVDSVRPDLILLDWMLPDVSGIDVSHQLRGRKEFDNVPIIMLTAKDQQVDKLEALSSGVDGYLTKPFDSMELLLCIRAFLRLTAKNAAEAPSVLDAHGLKLEPAKMLASVDGVEIQLTRMETAFLAHMMERPGVIFSAEDLGIQVMENTLGGQRSIDAVHAHIRNLRNKIEKDPKQPEFIITRGRKGYSFPD